MVLNLGLKYLLEREKGSLSDNCTKGLTKNHFSLFQVLSFGVDSISKTLIWFWFSNTGYNWKTIPIFQSTRRISQIGTKIHYFFIAKSKDFIYVLHRLDVFLSCRSIISKPTNLIFSTHFTGYKLKCWNRLSLLGRKFNSSNVIWLLTNLNN